MRYMGQFLFCLAALGIGAVSISLFIYFKPDAEKKDVVHTIPKVKSYTCKAFEGQVPIQSQGSIRAFRESDISAEVDGQIISLSDSFLTGRLVSKDEVLITIDPEPYQLALNAAKAQLAQAQLNLDQEQARAEQAKADWLDVGRDLKDASDLALRKPQIALAKAQIDAAKADIQLAERRLKRCVIRAPFTGFIEQTHVGLGQVIRSGTALAHIIDSSKVEVSLPILNQDMNFLDLPKENTIGSAVSIIARIGQEEHIWKATLTRLVPRIGGQNQQYLCVAEIEQPFTGNLPLLPDSFIEARISGKSVSGVFEIPRNAIHEGDHIWLIDEKNTLHKRSINIVRYNRQAIGDEVATMSTESVLVNSGVHAGERICLTRLPVMSENMQVSVHMPTPSNPDSDAH